MCNEEDVVAEVHLIENRLKETSFQRKLKLET